VQKDSVGMLMVGRKSSKVALINPPFTAGSYRHHLYLPIGLAYLAAVLEKNGHEVNVIDCQALEINQETLGAKLASFEPDVIGITAVAPLINSALQCARVAKKTCSNAQVVMGGPHATFMDEPILSEEAAVDVVVRGEGEQTLLELAQNQPNSSNLNTVNGITFRNKGQIVRTPNRAFIQNLEELPKPAYGHFQLEKYRLFGRTLLPVVTSRGCPFQCAFCVASRMFGKAYRMRSPKNVVDELEWLRDTHGAEAFTFYDDTLTFDKKRIYEICDEIKNRKIGLPWDCQSRVDQISKEILTKMKDAGCQQIFFGVESGCQQILDSVNKRTTVEQNEKAIKLAKETGLFVTISIMIGYPGETREARKQTLDFIRRAKPDDVYLCVATPYPGTELRSVVEKRGWKISSDWNSYDTMTLVFENPELSPEEAKRVRQKFYDDFYSPSYVFRQLLKRNSYSRMMARTAINHILWRMKSTPKADKEHAGKN